MQAQAQSSDHSLSMEERARGQNRIRHAINPRNVPYAVIRLHMYCAAKEVHCFVTRARAQYRMRAFSIPPLPLSPKHFRWRWRCISFHHIPRCVLCMQSRTTVVRSGPFVEKRRFLLVHFTHHHHTATRTYRPKGLPLITFIPRTIRAFDTELVGRSTPPPSVVSNYPLSTSRRFSPSSFEPILTV